MDPRVIRQRGYSNRKCHSDGGNGVTSIGSVTGAVVLLALYHNQITRNILISI